MPPLDAAGLAGFVETAVAAGTVVGAVAAVVGAAAEVGADWLAVVGLAAGTTVGTGAAGPQAVATNANVVTR